MDWIVVVRIIHRSSSRNIRKSYAIGRPLNYLCRLWYLLLSSSSFVYSVVLCPVLYSFLPSFRSLYYHQHHHHCGILNCGTVRAGTTDGVASAKYQQPRTYFCCHHHHLCTVLCRIVLYCVVLCCVVLYCVRFCILFYNRSVLSNCQNAARIGGGHDDDADLLQIVARI